MRVKRRREHIARSDALRNLGYRLSTEGVASEEEVALLYAQSAMEWDDAIHIASPDDPLRSLCGLFGRNLTDLPDKPDSWGGCWTCLDRAAEQGRQGAEELAVA
jgi:hypothetical protein